APCQLAFRVLTIVRRTTARRSTRATTTCTISAPSGLAGTGRIDHRRTYTARADGPLAPSETPAPSRKSTYPRVLTSADDEGEGERPVPPASCSGTDAVSVDVSVAATPAASTLMARARN